ncbi:XRE family transcriptional regulator [Thermomonospora amylolytica]|uniref:XRE family transcriptional regulator n=1 Tax=Thermomonospora amylolytica TaxID=1411117 RepID=UPI001F3F006E|nr:XRE family transcriptional regulator [Thermomonospora amylolytica]
MSRAKRRAKISPADRARGARLRAERERREWGRRELARLLLDAIDDRQKPSHVTVAGYIKNWEAGGGISSLYRATYAAVFGIPEDELFGPQEIPQDHSADPLGTVDPSPVPDLGDDDVRRRAALQLLAALGAGAAIPPGALERVLGGIDDALGNPVDLDEWERTVHEYGQVLMTRPAGALIQDLTADIIAVGELLKRQLDAMERTGLLRVSASLSGLLAIDLGDIGDQRAARVSWATAKRAADASGDTELQVWVRGRAAQDACWAGRPQAVITGLAAEAIEIAGESPSAGLARAHAARVCLAASQGDFARAHASLAELKRTFDLLPQDTEQSVLAFRETQLRWAESYVYTFAGDRRARDTVAHALHLYPSDAHGPRSNLELMDAAALIRAREVEAGLERALTVVERHPDATTAGRVALTGQILQMLPHKARELPAARELRALTSGA